VPRLALPFMQVRVGDALPAEMANRFQCGPPVRSANVNEDAVYIEDQDLGL
jgi:hypothetical protein